LGPFGFADIYKINQLLLWHGRNQSTQSIIDLLGGGKYFRHERAVLLAVAKRFGLAWL
jgi:hypothetical protein